MTDNITTRTTSTPDWTIVTGMGYGQPTWAEARRADGVWIIVDLESFEIMENGLVDEHGRDVTLPSDVSDQLVAMAM